MTAVDLNPVAHLIEKCVLEYPQRFGQPDERGENSLAEDFVEWASWVRKWVEPKFAKIFAADAEGLTAGCLLLGSHDEMPESCMRGRNPSPERTLASQ